MDKTKKYTILVVEDNELNCELLDAMLGEQYQLLFAHNGKEGMDVLHLNYKDIDVMLLDIQMPVMNGYQVLEEKGKEPLLKEIPVIVTTSNDSNSDEVKCLELGAQDFIRKPYDPIVVRLRIESIINLRESNEANHQKTLFIQAVSHEIRTPMNAIMGFVQLLGDGVEAMEPDEMQMVLGYIHDSSNTLLGMINNMMALANLDAGKFTIKKENISINQICRDAIQDASYCKPEGVNEYFTSDVDDLFLSNTDGKYLKQAIHNLVLNANKFTSQGEIHIDCSAKEKDGMIRITVTDTGIGINAEQAEYIFERFNKVDKFKPGIGLGLTIAKKIAASLEGDLYLDNTYTGGAKFVFEFSPN